MKEISGSLSQLIAKPEDIVTGILIGGETRKFEEAKFCSEVSCPICGGSVGYITCKLWVCVENCGFKKKVKTDIIIKSIEQFGCYGDFINASIDGCNKSKEIKEQFKKYAENPRGFYLLYGAFRKGKTYASCAMLDHYRLKGGIDARFVRVVDLFENLKECHFQNSNPRFFTEPLKECQLLVLDDIGTKMPTEAFLDVIYSIIDKRSLDKNKGTIVSSNADPENLRDIFGPRIISRIAEGKQLKFT